MIVGNVCDLFGNNDQIDNSLEDQEQEDLNASLKGRYAEFMVCAQISKAGYYVTHVDGVGFDLVIKTEHGSFTIQVKSTVYVKDGYCRWHSCIHEESGRGGRNKKRPQRPLSPRDADILALYHHVYETTLVIPITDNMVRSVSFKAYQIKQASLEASLASTLAVLKGI